MATQPGHVFILYTSDANIIRTLRKTLISSTVFHDGVPQSRHDPSYLVNPDPIFQNIPQSLLKSETPATITKALCGPVWTRRTSFYEGSSVRYLDETGNKIIINVLDKPGVVCSRSVTGWPLSESCIMTTSLNRYTLGEAYTHPHTSASFLPFE